MKKGIKIAILILIVLICVTSIGIGIYFASVWSRVSGLTIDEETLSTPSLAIELYDRENRLIKEENMFNGSYIKIDVLPEQAKQAFISIEDKDFYKHHGINLKRILKAAMNNIKSGKLKEGASTISQQLIKNTHLSSEKTFERKLKEISLALKLEKKYDKNKILEMYLNVIYFGNNCYGIESASHYYFSKNAHDLNLEETALLAGMIKSPNRYSPIKDYNRSLSRRNLVLDEMQKDGFITAQQCQISKNKPIELNLSTNKINKLNSYSQACIDEAQKILGLPAKQIALKGYKLYTYLDNEKQSDLENALESVDIKDADHAGIVIENSSGAIVAYYGQSNYNILEAKRQPGSCIKPILVYGPALNEDVIYPCTQILDEKTTISGYSPKNVGGNYQGYISAREALSKSINIPAVKVLSYVGIDKAKSYAESLGIKFDEKDDSFSLALGGMNYGTNIKDLTGAYSALGNEGNYNSPKFISFITDSKNKIIYVHNGENKSVFREDSTYLLTDMLKTCAKEGTARKLSDLNIDIASKTGTVGKSGSSENLDAWNISYTKDYSCGVWVGNLDNTPININGGNAPTQIVKNYFKAQPDNSHFVRPSMIEERNIDSIELKQNHKVTLANTYTPDCYTQKEIFSVFNLPSTSKHFVEIEEPQIKSQVIDDKAVLTLDSKEYLVYEIYKNNVSDSSLLATIENKTGKQILEFEMKNEREKFIIATSYKGSNANFKEIELIKTKPSLNKKWYV